LQQRAPFTSTTFFSQAERRAARTLTKQIHKVSTLEALESLVARRQQDFDHKHVVMTLRRLATLCA